jgi:hypothetical protein
MSNLWFGALCSLAVVLLVGCGSGGGSGGSSAPTHAARINAFMDGLPELGLGAAGIDTWYFDIEVWYDAAAKAIGEFNASATGFELDDESSSERNFYYEFLNPASKGYKGITYSFDEDYKELDLSLWKDSEFDVSEIDEVFPALDGNITYLKVSAYPSSSSEEKWVDYFVDYSHKFADHFGMKYKDACTLEEYGGGATDVGCVARLPIGCSDDCSKEYNFYAASGGDAGDLISLVVKTIDD